MYALRSHFPGYWRLWRKKKDPDEVPSESISDIPAYNRAVSRLWGGYSAVWFISGLIALWSPMAATVLMCVLGAAGAVVLVLIYKRIEKKYRVK